METALVTGGAGFIGSHLCDFLIEKGIKVICVDNLITGNDKNIKHLLGNKNFEFINADITKELKFDLKLDYIYHLASPASPVDYQEKPEETAMVNSFGTLSILKLSLKTGAKALVASTSEVYGDPLEHPQKETYWGNVNSFGPRACYDESKRFAETLTYIYIQKYNLDARIIRIFNTYGPRMRADDGRVISNFITQAIDKKPLTIQGDGSQTRSFCFVSDLIEGVFKAMTSSGTKGEIFNLGNPDEYKMIDLAQKILGLFGSKEEFEHKPLPLDDPQKRRPDISKAKKILGWEPKIGLDEGLKKTIEFYQNL